MAEILKGSYVAAALSAVLVFGLAAGLVTRVPWKRALLGLALGYGLAAISVAGVPGLGLRLLPLFLGSALTVFGLLAVAARLVRPDHPAEGVPLARHWRGDVSPLRAVVDVCLGTAFFVLIGIGLDAGPDHPFPRALAGGLAVTWVAGIAGVTLLLIGAWRAAGSAARGPRAAARVVLVLFALVLAGVALEFGQRGVRAQARVALGGEAAGVNQRGAGSRQSPLEAAPRPVADLARAHFVDLELVPAQSQPAVEKARESMLFAAQTPAGTVGVVLLVRFPEVTPSALWDDMWEGFSNSWAGKVERVRERSAGRHTFRYGRMRDESIPFRDQLWFRAYGDVAVGVMAATEAGALSIAEALVRGWGS